MKKIVSVFFSILMLALMTAPVTVFAAEPQLNTESIKATIQSDEAAQPRLKGYFEVYLGTGSSSETLICSDNNLLNRTVTVTNNTNNPGSARVWIVTDRTTLSTKTISAGSSASWSVGALSGRYEIYGRAVDTAGSYLFYVKDSAS